LVRPVPGGFGDSSTAIKKLLVPLDGSELAHSAVPFAEGLAKTIGASIVLFHALTPPVVAYQGGEAIGLDPRLIEGLEEGARRFLTEAEQEVSSKGLRAKAVLGTGSPVDSIGAAARQEGADIIVMSTHGRSGLGRFVLGSVADAVVRRTSLPVILVRPEVSS